MPPPGPSVGPHPSLVWAPSHIVRSVARITKPVLIRLRAVSGRIMHVSTDAAEQVAGGGQNARYRMRTGANRTARKPTIIADQRAGYGQDDGCEHRPAIEGDGFRHPAGLFHIELASGSAHIGIVEPLDSAGSIPAASSALRTREKRALNRVSAEVNTPCVRRQSDEKKSSYLPQVSWTRGISHCMMGLLNEYKPSLSYQLRRPRYVRSTVALIAKFIRRGNVHTPAGITATVLREYFADMADSQAAVRTMHNHLAALRPFFTWMIERGLLARDPAQNMRLRPADAALPIWLTQDELTAALEAVRPIGLWSEVALAVSTGLRMSELRGLCRAHINLPAKVVIVRGKGGKVRQVPLSLLACQALRATSNETQYVFPGWRCSRDPSRLADRPRSERWWTTISTRRLHAAVPAYARIPRGQTGRGWHLFRHTFASHLVQAGVRIYKVSQWLGHSSVHTTQMYAHLAPGYDDDIELVLPEAREGKKGK